MGLPVIMPHCSDDKQMQGVASVPSEMLTYLLFAEITAAYTVIRQRFWSVEFSSWKMLTWLVNNVTFWVHLSSSCCFHLLNTEMEPGFGIWEGLCVYWLKLL